MASSYVDSKNDMARLGLVGQILANAICLIPNDHLTEGERSRALVGPVALPSAEATTLASILTTPV